MASSSSLCRGSIGGRSAAGLRPRPILFLSHSAVCGGLPRTVSEDAGPSTSTAAAVCSSLPGLRLLRCRPAVLAPCGLRGAAAAVASCTPRATAAASGLRAGQTVQAAASSSSSSAGSSSSSSCSRANSSSGASSSAAGGAASAGVWPGLRPRQQQQRQQHRSQGPQATSRRVAAAAAAAAAADGGASGPGGGAGGLVGEAQKLVGTVSHQAGRFWALSGKFMPMVGLFFMLAFVNTILDSLKDTLVITAAGGGAQVIPYLTVYAVLPSSLVFLLAYSYASQRFRRQALFNGIVGVFMAFFAVFALWLYPNHHLLHPTSWAEGAAAALPLGLDGLVGMVRNWTFTAFFCMSELWGDVCLGLLFWGLANDTTALADAPTLYPLFGLGANVAQALAGFVLKFFSGPASHGGSFTSEVQSLMGVVMVFSAAALALHHAISAQHTAHRAERRAARNAERAAQQQAVVAAAAAAVARGDAPAAALPHPGTMLATASASTDTPPPAQPPLCKDASSTRPKKSKQSMGEIYRTLASSTPIRCLVVMSMAQGLCTNLMEFAWKSHIRLLYPTPAEFTSFLGDVSTWQGIVTGLLMVLSPTMFERLGWAGVAAATPQILLYGGGAFFAVAMAYQFVMAPAAGVRRRAAVRVQQERQVQPVQAGGGDGVHQPGRGGAHQGQGRHRRGGQPGGQERRQRAAAGAAAAVRRRHRGPAAHHGGRLPGHEPRLAGRGGGAVAGGQLRPPEHGARLPDRHGVHGRGAHRLHGRAARRHRQQQQRQWQRAGRRTAWPRRRRQPPQQQRERPPRPPQWKRKRPPPRDLRRQQWPRQPQRQRERPPQRPPLSDRGGRELDRCRLCAQWRAQPQRPQRQRRLSRGGARGGGVSGGGFGRGDCPGGRPVGQSGCGAGARQSGAATAHGVAMSM